jgi:hypothetical protein
MPVEITMEFVKCLQDKFIDYVISVDAYLNNIANRPYDVIGKTLAD